jgi:hypothetical protein
MSQDTPAEFSVRGPHNTVPWIAIVDHNNKEGTLVRSTMLMWAKDEKQARRWVSGWHRNPEKVELHAANPNHHLGSKSVVLDITSPLPEISEEAEDILDAEYIRRALADPANKDTIPWEEITRELDYFRNCPDCNRRTFHQETADQKWLCLTCKHVGGGMPDA